MALINVPLTGQDLNTTRVPINTNFATISTAFEVDHVAYNNSSPTQGKHNKVTFPQLGAPATFAAGEEGLYNYPLSGVNELYVHKQSAAGTQEIPLTASILSGSTPTLGTGGWTYLPSGIYMTFGYAVNTGSFVFTIPNPPPTQLLTMIVTPAGSGTLPTWNAQLTAYLTRSTVRINCTINGAPGTVGFSYIAIGF